MSNPSVPNILVKFARLLGTTLTDNRLEIPAASGSGYCAGYVFDTHLRMLISDYHLNDDLPVKKPQEIVQGELLFFKFRDIFPKERSSAVTPSVLIATSRISTGEVFAIHSNTATINIEVNTHYLASLLPLQHRSPLLQRLLQPASPLFFEQLLYPALLGVVEQIVNQRVSETFSLFFLKIKAEELICRLLMELDQREEKKLYPLNGHDIQTIYKVKEQLLAHLDHPPVIAELADQAAMSPTKLKRLFRQIFGSGIYHYYQQFRMKEAARLLQAEQLPVSAAGYRLGFTNLSHFSRLFKEHIGMRPKEYSRLAQVRSARTVIES